MTGLSLFSTPTLVMGANCERAGENKAVPLGWQVESLFKAKAVNKVDAERDRATPRKRSGGGASPRPLCPLAS
jgi:hypothetical protein